MTLLGSPSRPAAARRLSFLASLIAMLAAFAPAAGAAATTYAFDRAHSSPTFTIRHFFTQVPGRFTDFDGTIRYDQGNPTASVVEVTIQTASINTDNPKRDGHLKSADFFDAEKNPTITFKSTKVEKGEAKDAYKVTGDLTMAGVTKPVVLDVQYLGSMPDMKPNAKRVGFLATTTLNRQDFGIKWNRALDNGGTLLGDDVKITFSVEAVSQ